MMHSTLVSKGSENLDFNRIPVTPILPISEELLTYLDVKDLNDRITFTQQKNASIVVNSAPHFERYRWEEFRFCDLQRI